MRTVRERTIGHPSARDEVSERGFRVALLLREINALIGERVARSLEGEDLTLPQLTLIKVLAHRGGAGITELAREMSATKSTVAGIVDRLERAGIVERRRGEGDRRAVTVTFSGAASVKVAAARLAVEDCFARAFGGLSPEELAALEDSLATVKGALEAPEGDPQC